MNLPLMADQLTKEEKRRCQQWLNEHYGQQLAAQKRRRNVMEARSKIEQEQENDYGFDGETTRRI